MTTFIDTNVIIALLDPSEPHHAWSVAELQKCKANGPALICDIIYCELSAGMTSQADVDAVVDQFALERVPGDQAILFRAGTAFKAYKKNKGEKKNVLPDFLIGAFAEVTESPLITANKQDFVKYFPNLSLITP